MLNPVLIIISLNLGVFIAVHISPEILGYLSLPPNFDRPWAILTSMFTHYDFFHIFANMITLFFFGSFLNRLVGERKFLLVYFGGGILGSLFFILLAGSGSPPAIGASGAVFALGGALAVIAPRLRVIVFPIPAPMPLWMAVVGIFIILTVLPILNILPNIAWEAHLGGFLFGLVAGYFFRGKGRYQV
jgi:membrane associated rhomboid family serine protease